MKYVKWIVIVACALVIIVIAVAILSIDGIIRSTVERQATSSLNLTTTLGGAHLSIFGGSLALNDLAIDSPAGFTAKQMFDLGKAELQVSYGQLRNQPVHISAITLENPKLVIEQANGKLNLQALTDQESKTPTTPSGKTTEPMKLIIDKLAIDGAAVTVLPGIPGMDKPIDITVPAIEMDHVGSDGAAGNGVAVKDVAMKVMTAIAAKCADSDKLPPEVKVLLSGNVGALQSKVTGQLGKVLDGATSGDRSQMKSAEKGLKNLLGGNGEKTGK